MRVQRFVASAGDCTGNDISDAIIHSHVALVLVEPRTFGARVVYERYVRA